MHSLASSLSLLLLLSPLTHASPITLSPKSQIPSGCDLSAVTLPKGSKLPSPPSELRLQHVTFGVGTQNYTCPAQHDGPDQSVQPAPEAAGALASLFDISCLVTQNPDRLANIVKTALSKDDAKKAIKYSEGILELDGSHYFTNNGPFFDLRANGGKAYATVDVAEKVPPPSSPLDYNYPPVEWLQLPRATGESNGIEMVYRVETHGGKAPETCKGMDTSFEVPYVAQYWFYDISNS